MKIIFLLLFPFLITFNIYSQFDTESKILGEWVDNGQPKFLFNSENIFQLNLENNLVIEGNYILIEPDTLRVFLEDAFFIDYVYKYFNDSLVLYSFKNHSGPLKEHLDEITLLTRKNNSRQCIDTLNSLRNDMFLLPDNFIGKVYVNFDQIDGQTQNFDNEGNRIIKIPESGYVKTIFKEEPLKYALEKMCFIQKETALPYFIESKKRKMNEKEFIEEGYNLESVYVCIEGYNQTSRKIINEVYGQEIKGNVLMFQIDTLKNILNSWKKF